eukprot:15433621-Alexandrium_andersonii.AAC.1
MRVLHAPERAARARHPGAHGPGRGELGGKGSQCENVRSRPPAPVRVRPGEGRELGVRGPSCPV